jgi:lipid-binding SYLF domain-containing protein
MQRFLIVTLVLVLGISSANTSAAADTTETIRRSEQVLADLMAIPARQIPQHLLAGATAVAVIPDVTKIGFIAGVRRGHGVVMVRDTEGEWSLPQFITLTGGSVGWQAGIQGTDVVLVFRTRKGVEGLMRGKFTIGADASVSAGPIGRNAEAATDSSLRAEILSYSRSRGLFLGVAIDGSALEIDQFAHADFYGSPTPELPRHLPESAAQLRQYLVELTQANPEAPKAGEEAPPHSSGRKLEVLRLSLVHHAGHLHAMLSPAWRQYLAFPKELLDPAAQPNLEALTALQQRFAKIETTPSYKGLADHPEFQATHELLREYILALSASGPTLHIPPPPVK